MVALTVSEHQDIAVPPVEFVHCGVVHYVTTRPVSRSIPVPADALSLVCGRCPDPRDGLMLLCHMCSLPIDVRDAAGVLLWEHGRQIGLGGI